MAWASSGQLGSAVAGAWFENAVAGAGCCGDAAPRHEEHGTNATARSAITRTWRNRTVRPTACLISASFSSAGLQFPNVAGRPRDDRGPLLRPFTLAHPHGMRFAKNPGRSRFAMRRNSFSVRSYALLCTFVLSGPVTMWAHAG